MVSGMVYNNKNTPLWCIFYIDPHKKKALRLSAQGFWPDYRAWMLPMMIAATARRASSVMGVKTKEMV